MAENKEPSQRQLRVGQEIKRILAAFIQKGEIRNLEGIDTIVTITEVTVSPDLKYASVYLMTLNNSHLQEVIGGYSWRPIICANRLPQKCSFVIRPNWYLRSTRVLNRLTRLKNC